MPAGPIYIWLILRNKAPNEFIMVGEVHKDCTVQAYKHGILRFESPVLLCLVVGLTCLRLNGSPGGPPRSVCVLLPVSTSIPYS